MNDIAYDILLDTGITQPRMNNLVKNRTFKFSLDALLNVAAQLGCTIKLSLKKAA